MQAPHRGAWEYFEEQLPGVGLFFRLGMSKHLHPRLKIFLTLLLSFAIATPAHAQSTQAEEKPADSIRGLVINSVTHEPIGRALVYSPDNRFATMTNSEGRFEFKLVQPEAEEGKENKPVPGDATTMTQCVGGSCTTYSSTGGQSRPTQLMARKPGFLNDPNGIQNLPREPAGKELTISLTAEALVVGRVVLPSSEPSDEIQLEIYRRQVQDGRAHWIAAGSVSTRSNGEFRFAELSAGSYKLLTREQLDRDPLTFDPRGQQYGYPPVYFPNATDFAAAQTIQLTAGQIFQADISLVKHAYYPIKVAVANAAENVRGLGIVVSAQGHRGPGYALGYNHRDQMIEGLLPDGNFTLEAASFGPNAASGQLNISVKGAAVEGPRMTLVPNGAISVNVQEEFTSGENTSSERVVIHRGGPRRNVYVRLEPADDFGQERGAGMRNASGPTDDSLAIEGVQPGRYWVRVDASRGFVASVTSGTTDLQHHLLAVGPGGSSSPIEITLRDSTAELDGTVEGMPTASASQGTAAPAIQSARMAADGSFGHVYCVPLPDSSGEFKDIGVAPDGKFGPRDLSPGTYRVLAFNHREELEYRDPEAMRAYDAKGLLVRLVPGQKEHLQLPLIVNSE
jgi:hypothetical protein